MRDRPASSDHRRRTGQIERRRADVLGIGFGAAIYIVLLITLGVMTLRRGHWVMFILGIFLPFFWLIGAVIPPIRPQTAS